jgi:TolB protein
MSPKIVRSVLILVLIGGAGLVLPVAGAGAAERSASGDGRGSKIAFSRLCLITDCPLTVEHQQTEIWVMNGDGSNAQQLTHNTTWDLGAVWSPNRKTVAFFGVQYVPSASDPTKDVPISEHVYLIDANSSDQRPLAPNQPGRWPSFSPDGKKIAFDNVSGGPNSDGDIFVVNSDGTGSPQDLTKDLPVGRNIRPDWSPDGQRIAFVRNGEIEVMNADGSNPTCLTCRSDGTNDGGLDNAPAWSPNGQQIAFQKTIVLSNGAGHLEVYVMNADGSDETPLTNYDPNTNPGDSDDPSWSPNGQQITFERDIQVTGAPEIFTMNADGSDVAQLTGLPSLNGHPGWGRGPSLAP